MALSSGLWAGQLSRYSDWLRAGRSGDRIPVGGEIFRTYADRPWGPTSLLYNGYRVFPGGKERPGLDADHSPPSSTVVMKGQSYTSTPPMSRTACTEPQCLYKGDFCLTLHYLSPVKLQPSKRNNIQSPRSRVLPETLTVPQVVKKFPRILWKQNVHYRIHPSLS